MYFLFGQLIHIFTTSKTHLFVFWSTGQKFKPVTAQMSLFKDKHIKLFTLITSDAMKPTDISLEWTHGTFEIATVNRMSRDGSRVRGGEGRNKGQGQPQLFQRRFINCVRSWCLHRSKQFTKLLIHNKVG